MQTSIQNKIKFHIIQYDIILVCYLLHITGYVLIFNFYESLEKRE
jgi:hypothetical protein